MERLATAASMSRRMVINVEQGAVNPSVGILLRLAEALGVGLPALVEPPERPELSVTRSGDGACAVDRSVADGGSWSPGGRHPTSSSCGTGPWPW